MPGSQHRDAAVYVDYCTVDESCFLRRQESDRGSDLLRSKWEYEIDVQELNATVFLIPWNFGGRRPRSGVKNRRDRLVVLNSVARSVIEGQRGEDPVWVFSRGGKPVQQMLQKAWCLARQRAAEKWRELKKEPAPAGFAKLRVHDLKHTFGHRLEAAGVSDRDCQARHCWDTRAGVSPVSTWHPKSRA